MKLKKLKEPVSLEELAPGHIFMCDKTFGVKSEYTSSSGAIEAIIIGSGEFFWGGATSPEEQRKVMVYPVKIVK